MEKNKSFKVNNEIIRQLQSDDEKINLTVIDKMRSSGKIGYIPYLIELANSTNFDTVHSSVFNLLNELKEKGATNYLCEAIRDNQFKTIRKKLVEACWQNGLNFAQHLSLFTDLLIHESDEISFEAFTVIENMEYMPQNSILENEIEKLKSHLTGTDDPRQYFIKEAIITITKVLNQKN
ncbi:MAG: hypothetical protein HQ541_15530 [Mariniphaga sp.]|nr:hypothetical protein [Mariniphaga sp.]